MKQQTIAIIGAGNLGLAIYNGLDKGGLLGSNKLILTRRDITGLKDINHSAVTVISDNVKAVSQADIIIFAVQPKQLKKVLEEVREVLNPEKHTLISVITAVTITEIAASLNADFPIIRAMPNTAIAVLQSMTCMAYNDKGKEKVKAVQTIFNCVGKTLVIQEELMQAATVVCASGIAFWMRFIRATTQGGVQLGFDAEYAQEIAVQTCLGAASLLGENHGSHPEKEIDKVTTPQGCTISGLNEMEHNGLSSALIKGLVKSYERINKMKETT
ncbi:Pyrroline-5-carboxylate reductase [Fulvivirga imtechensis AK7]|uniref:Pyrroline-5-carboxylate reductase n=1 Tax=Fulvivirga imtechensis AK7 TaxID=1237149 RepID=L8JN07_9BACT|nr:pyrroline-5-carboxylate reductase [Fulvivirga imtechensis]ELR69618.1 Pyrroline-5-carboxylate reductase [Fulvivirga imtechensis AK7]